jgi:hypothetical protein
MHERRIVLDSGGAVAAVAAAGGGRRLYATEFSRVELNSKFKIQIDTGVILSLFTT